MNRPVQIVLDTNVLVSALRSQRGASFALLQRIGEGLFELNLSVPLVLEYESVTKRDALRGRLTGNRIDDILDYVCAVGRKHRIHFLWRPRERSPQDDMVLEVAVAGGCDAIVTYNVRDFPGAGNFGVEVLTPKEFLSKLGVLP
jgi:putative PIN family toxin of toxin-antitoxin system